MQTPYAGVHLNTQLLNKPIRGVVGGLQMLIRTIERRLKQRGSYRGLGRHTLVLPDVEHSGEGAHGIGDIIGAVSKGHDHSREHLRRMHVSVRACIISAVQGQPKLGLGSRRAKEGKDQVACMRP